MEQEYAGVVEEIGSDVLNVEFGDLVVGSIFTSDNTCEICQAGHQSRCINKVPMGPIGTQAERARVPPADSPWCPPRHNRTLS
jgi:threonine dehydrogenase-like Zn-dependent dehydrogenase